MESSGSSIAERLRRDGQRQLARRYDFNQNDCMGCAVFYGLLYLCVLPLAILTIGPVSSLLIALIISLFLLERRRVERKRELELWRERLVQNFRDNLQQRGLLLALLEAEPGRPLFAALGLDGSAWWMPLVLRLPVPRQQTFGRRIRLLVQRYDLCCEALQLPPFPPGFDDQLHPNRVNDLKNMWEALLMLTLADVLEGVEPEPA